MSPPALVDQVPCLWVSPQAPSEHQRLRLAVSTLCPSPVSAVSKSVWSTSRWVKDQVQRKSSAMADLPIGNLSLTSRKAVSYQSPLILSVLTGTQKRKTAYLPCKLNGSLSYCSHRGSSVYFLSHDLSVSSIFQSSQKAGGGTQRNMNAGRTPWEAMYTALEDPAGKILHSQTDVHTNLQELQ